MKMYKKFSTTIFLVGFPIFQAHADLRPLSTDRPDATESPQTVDKGYFQIETSFLSFSRDKQNQVTTTSWSGAETNFKYGVTSSMDLQLIFSPYVQQQVTSKGKTKTTESHGDITLRSKINLWGNDGGVDSLALLPYIKVPSGSLSNNHTEGGLIVTYAGEILNHGFGTQIEAQHVYNESSHTMDWAWSHTAGLGYDLNPKIGGYLEYVGEYSVDKDYLPYASFGFTLKAGMNAQWDIGSRVGLTSKAEDFQGFVGFSQRF